MISINCKTVESIRKAPPGSPVRGTYDRDAGVGSVVTVDVDPPQSFVHAVIGRIDQADIDFPLAIEREGDAITVRDQERGALSVKIVSEDDFYARNPFDGEVRESLRNRRILVVGQGSIGSVLTIALARAGVGHVVGSDPDDLEVHNCMRHALSTEYIGWNKATAMAQWMKTGCPECVFIPVPRDLFSGNRSALKRILDEHKPHAVVAVTDAKGANTLSQMAAIYAGAAYFAMGCFNNAIEGEVFIRLPESPVAPDDPVGYACYEELHPPGKGERRATQYDYSTDLPGRYAGEPALGHLINHKVYLAATILVDMLLFDSPSSTAAADATRAHLSRGAQYVRIGGPYLTSGGVKAVELTKPWQVKWTRIRAHNDCAICGNGTDVARGLFPMDEIAPDLDEEEWDL